MTSKITTKSQAVETAVPPKTENPQLDERLWRAWIEKNEKRDKMKLARRIKVIAILVALLALTVLFQRAAG